MADALKRIKQRVRRQILEILQVKTRPEKFDAHHAKPLNTADEGFRRRLLVRHLHHHVEKGGMPDVMGEPLADERAKRIIKGCVRLLENRLHLIRALLRNPVHDRMADIHLAREEIVDGADGKLGSAGDFRNFGSLKALFNKNPLRRQKNRLLVLEKFPFAAIVPVSAEKGRQLPELLEEVKKFLPESVPYFDPDFYTDRSPRYMAAETIREKAFRLLGDELPYGVAVTIDKWTETEEGAEIIAGLIVERESHKAIVIGEKGGKLREISRLARADIATMLGKRVYLEVWVRVRRGWSDDVKALKTLGYD